MPRKAGWWDASFAAWDFSQSNKALHPALYNKYSLYLSLRYCNIHISEAVVRSCSVKIVFLKILQSSQVFSLAQEFPVNFATFLKNSFFRKTPPGICVVFLVHGTILQQWTSLLKNSACIEKRKNLDRECWRIVQVTVEESCQSLLNNCTSGCRRIIPVNVEESCQPLLINHDSDCWKIVPVIVE